MKLRVTTHSGEDDVVEVEDYNAAELNQQMNDRELHSLAIGNHIYSRIDLKNIQPIKE